MGCCQLLLQAVAALLVLLVAAAGAAAGQVASVALLVLLLLVVSMGLPGVALLVVGSRYLEQGCHLRDATSSGTRIRRPPVHTNANVKGPTRQFCTVLGIAHWCEQHIQ
jgi:hypothetical protein